jgi:hypothetical protein
MSGLPGTPGTSRQKKYSVIASYILSSTVSQDRFTLLEVNERLTIGTPGTSKAIGIFSYFILYSLKYCIPGQVHAVRGEGHDERLTRNTPYVYSKRNIPLLHHIFSQVLYPRTGSRCSR